MYINFGAAKASTLTKNTINKQKFAPLPSKPITATHRTYYNRQDVVHSSEEEEEEEVTPLTFIDDSLRLTAIFPPFSPANVIEIGGSVICVYLFASFLAIVVRLFSPRLLLRPAI